MLITRTGRNLKRHISNQKTQLPQRAKRGNRQSIPHFSGLPLKTMSGSLSDGLFSSISAGFSAVVRFFKVKKKVDPKAAAASIKITEPPEQNVVSFFTRGVYALNNKFFSFGFLESSLKNLILADKESRKKAVSAIGKIQSNFKPNHQIRPAELSELGSKKRHSRATAEAIMREFASGSYVARKVLCKVVDAVLKSDNTDAQAVVLKFLKPYKLLNDTLLLMGQKLKSSQPFVKKVRALKRDRVEARSIEMALKSKEKELQNQLIKLPANAEEIASHRKKIGELQAQIKDAEKAAGDVDLNLKKEQNNLNGEMSFVRSRMKQVEKYLADLKGKPVKFTDEEISAMSNSQVYNRYKELIKSDKEFMKELLTYYEACRRKVINPDAV